MNEIFKRHKLLKLTHEEMDHLSGPVSIKEIEYLITVLSAKEPQSHMAPLLTYTVH